MGEILSFIQTNLIWIILVGVGVWAYRWWQSRPTTIAPAGQSVVSMPSSLGGIATALAVVASVALIGLTVIFIFNPKALNLIVSDSGMFGPQRQTDWAKADVAAAALYPKNDPALWKSAPAQAAAEAITSEYQLAKAKNQAAIAAAKAEEDCYKGDTSACAKSVPAGVQASTRAVAKTTGEVAQNAGNAIAKLDLEARDKELSQPLGQAPESADSWLRQVYNLPKGFLVIGSLLLSVLVVGITVRAFR